MGKVISWIENVALANVWSWRVCVLLLYPVYLFLMIVSGVMMAIDELKYFLRAEYEPMTLTRGAYEAAQRQMQRRRERIQRVVGSVD